MGDNIKYVQLKLLKEEFYKSMSYSEPLMIKGIVSGLIKIDLEKDLTYEEKLFEISYWTYIYSLDEEKLITTKILYLSPSVLIHNNS